MLEDQVQGATEKPDLLVILLHGVGATPESLSPLAATITGRFANVATVIPPAPLPFDTGPSGRQWFSVRGVTEGNRTQRVCPSSEHLAQLAG